mgnify:CR=1 FL=1
MIYSSYCSWSSKRDITQYNSVWKNGTSKLTLPIDERNHFRQHSRKLGYVFFTSSFAPLAWCTPQNDVDLLLRAAHTTCSYLNDCPLIQNLSQCPQCLSYPFSKLTEPIYFALLYCFQHRWDSACQIKQNGGTSNKMNDKTIFEGCSALRLLLSWFRCLYSVFQSFFI